MGHLDNFGQRWPSVDIIDMEHSRRSRSERGRILPGFRAANSGAGHNLVESDLHEPSPAGPDGVVVAIALLTRNHELVGKAVAVGQAFHATQIVARENGGTAD